VNATLIARLLALRRELRHRDRWTRRELETHQAGALRTLRDFAYARSPFYQRFHKGLTARPLHTLPVLTKTMVMEEFDELVTDSSVIFTGVSEHLARLEAGESDRYLDRYWVTSTSGTTGLRGVFLSDIREWTTILASYVRASDWAGVETGLARRTRIAVVASRTPWHQSSLVGAAVQNSWIPVLRLDAADPLPTLVERLQAFGPDLLVAYPSIARLLADEQLGGRLHIAPQWVMCASEVLGSDTRRRIEQAWSRKPFNVYGATEPAGIASECERHTGLHLYEDLVITEVVDEHNQPVPQGSYGEKVLVTVLFSRTQPLIRYEMSDSVRLSSVGCPCGRPFALLDDIQGRQEDIVYLPGSNGTPTPIHPNVFHRALELVPASAWQVIHDRTGLRVLLVGARDDLDERSLLTAISQVLEAQGAMPIETRVERVAAIPRTTTGKAPLILESRTDTHLARRDGV
jgi:putative adenylate-forming enzyme